MSQASQYSVNRLNIIQPVVERNAVQIANILNELSRINTRGLTENEIEQIENIGNTTISSEQWAFLGAMDQGVATTDNVTFNIITATQGIVGTILTGSQPNITEVGTLTSLDVTGSITIGGDINIDSDTLVVDGTNNRVGINNAAPTTDLDVTGSILFSGTLNNVTQAEFSQLENIGGTTISAAQWGFLGLMDQDVSSGSNVVFGTIVGTLLTGAQPNITSVGTLDDLDVTGDLTVDTDVLFVDTTNDRVGINNAAPTTDLDVTGSILFSGNLNNVTATEFSQLETIGATTISAAQWGFLGAMDQDVSSGSNVVFGTIGGTLTTAAQPNITSVGTLTSLMVTGDLTIGGDINIDSDTLVVDGTNNRVGINNATPSTDLDVTGNILFSGTLNSVTLAEFSQLENIGATTISAAQWGFLGAMDQGVATTDSVTFVNIGGTLTTAAQPNITSVGTLTALTVSGNVVVDTDVLVVDTTNDRVGINTAAPATDLDVTGSIAFTGNLNNVTAVEFSQLETIGATTISAAQWGFLGAMDQGVATTDSVTFVNIGGTLTTAAQPNITSVGTLTSLMVTGDLTIGGDINIDSDTLVVDGTNNRVGINNATPSTDLDVTGNILFSGNLNNVTATELSQLETIGATTISAAQWGFLGAMDQGVATTDSVTFVNIGGTLTTAAQPNITSVGTLTSLTVTGNLAVDTNVLFVDTTNNRVGINDGAPSEALDVVGNALISGTVNGVNNTEFTQLANIDATTISTTQWGFLGAMDQGVATTDSVTFVNIGGTLTTAAQPNITSLGTLTSLSVSGDITIDTNVLVVDTTNNRVGINDAAPSEALDVVGNALISGTVNGVNNTEFTQLANIDATTISTTQWGFLGAMDQGVATTDNVTFGNIAGTLTTAAQPNITSVGTLTSLTVTGDLTVDTDTLFVDTTNDRVGINNAAPSVALDVVGSIAFDTNLNNVTAAEFSQLETLGATTISAANWGHVSTMNQDVATTSNVTFDEITGTGDLTIGTDTLFADVSTDRVGIGTATPANARISLTYNSGSAQMFLARDDGAFQASMGIIADRTWNFTNTSGNRGWEFTTNTGSGIANRFFMFANGRFTINQDDADNTTPFVYQDLNGAVPGNFRLAITKDGTDGARVDLYEAGTITARVCADSFSYFNGAEGVAIGKNTITAGIELDVAGDIAFTGNLNNVTATEFSQLETMGGTTISAVQWGYLGAMDQGVATTDDVVFNNMTGGQHAPTLTNLTNVTLTGSTINSVIYQRVEDIVSLSGMFVLRTNAATTTWSVEMDLPITSNFASTIDALGSGTWQNDDGTDDTASMVIISAETTNDTIVLTGEVGEAFGSGDDLNVQFSLHYVVQ